MLRPERPIRIDQAYPLIQAFAANAWIRDPIVTSPGDSKVQTLAGQLWVPEKVDSKRGNYRPVCITVCFPEINRGFGPWLDVAIPLSERDLPPDFLDFPDELNQGLRTYLDRQVAPRNPEQTYRIVPNVPHDENNGLATLTEPTTDTIPDESATWSMSLDLEQLGISRMDSGKVGKLVDGIVRRMALTVPAVRSYVAKDFPRTYQQLVQAREKRMRAKPPGWIFNFFRSRLSDLEGEWFKPDEGVEPEEFAVTGVWQRKNSAYTVFARSTEERLSDGQTRQKFLLVRFVSHYILPSREIKKDLDLQEGRREFAQFFAQLIPGSSYEDGAHYLVSPIYSYNTKEQTHSVGLYLAPLYEINDTQHTLCALELRVSGSDLAELKKMGVTPEKILVKTMEKVDRVTGILEHIVEKKEYKRTIR